MRILMTCVLIALCSTTPEKEKAHVEVNRVSDGSYSTDQPVKLTVQIVSRSVFSLNYSATIQQKRGHFKRIPVFMLKEDVTELKDVELDKEYGMSRRGFRSFFFIQQSSRYYHDVNDDSLFYIRVSKDQKLIEIVSGGRNYMRILCGKMITLDACYYTPLMYKVLFDRWLQEGYFYFNGAYYTITRHSYSDARYSVSKLLIDDNKAWTKYHIDSGLDASQFSRTFPTRDKRQAQLYEVELCLALDYSIYETWYTRFYTTDADDLLASITQYYSHIVNSVDCRFRGIRGSGYVITVLFASLYIAQDPKMSPWADLNTKITSEGPVVSEKSLKALADWSNRQGPLSNCDHVMGLTASNLAHEGSVNTLGLTHLQSMCSNRSYSIIEDHGNIAYVSLIASHELAHSLGAKHDGDPAKVRFEDKTAACRTDDGYIMKSRASSVPKAHHTESVRRWFFSPCSRLYFDFYMNYLDSIGANCLVQRNTGFDESMDGSDQSFELLNDLDYYCETLVGSGSVLLRRKLNGNFSDICRSVPCSDSSKSAMVPTLASEGLKCGPKHSCHLGKCEIKPGQEAAVSDLDRICPFGDQAGVIRGAGQTCETLISSADQAFRCYEVETECCKTCYRYKRKFMSLPMCEFGDKVDNCADVDCDLDTFGRCCEICAIRKGNLSECPDISPPTNGRVETNTGTLLEGSVATFLCNQGYSLIGNKTSVCATPGSWTSGTPKCIQGCREIHPQQYSTVRLSRNDNSFGTEALFACRHNLTLIGERIIVCQNDTRWSEEEPRCGVKFTSVRHVSVVENSDPSTFTHQLETGLTPSTFSLVSTSGPGFSVSRSGVVTSRLNVTLNYERIMTYRLLVEATCTVDKRLSARQHLVIGVKDLNDPPTFTKQEYKAHIWMPVPKGGQILQVFAIDEDASTQTISFSLTETRLFQIDRASGSITSLYGIQIDSRAEHVFTVMATDNGLPSKSASAVVKLCIGRHECDVSSGSGISLFLSYSIYILVFCVRKYLWHII